MSKQTTGTIALTLAPKQDVVVAVAITVIVAGNSSAIPMAPLSAQGKEIMQKKWVTGLRAQSSRYTQAFTMTTAVPAEDVFCCQPPSLF